MKSTSAPTQVMVLLICSATCSRWSTNQVTIEARHMNTPTESLIIDSPDPFGTAPRIVRLLSWPASLCVEMSVRYEVRLTGSCFRLK